MVVYKQSDVKLSWEANETAGEDAFPKVCGYVKEGAGETNFRISNVVYG